MAERRLAALGDFTQSVRAWSNLAANGALASPKEWVGARLRFQDGTAPFVFRETVRRKASTDDPAVIVIQFRLTFLGSSPSRHAAFRRECILHTPLFAGFPGFRSKQWADDLRTGVYAGIYEWQGADLASTTPSALVGLLTPRDATEGHRPLRQRAYPPMGASDGLCSRASCWAGTRGSTQTCGTTSGRRASVTSFVLIKRPRRPAGRTFFGQGSRLRWPGQRLVRAGALTAGWFNRAAGAA